MINFSIIAKALVNFVRLFESESARNEREYTQFCSIMADYGYTKNPLIAVFSHISKSGKSEIWQYVPDMTTYTVYNRYNTPVMQVTANPVERAYSAGLLAFYDNGTQESPEFTGYDQWGWTRQDWKDFDPANYAGKWSQMGLSLADKDDPLYKSFEVIQAVYAGKSTIDRYMLGAVTDSRALTNVELWKSMVTVKPETKIWFSSELANSPVLF